MGQPRKTHTEEQSKCLSCDHHKMVIIEEPNYTNEPRPDTNPRYKKKALCQKGFYSADNWKLEGIRYYNEEKIAPMVIKCDLYTKQKEENKQLLND